MDPISFAAYWARTATWGDWYKLGAVVILGLRISQLSYPGRTGHRQLVEARLDDVGEIPWFVLVAGNIVTDAVFWPVAMVLEARGTVIAWRARQAEMDAGMDFTNRRLRRLGRALVRRPQRYAQLCTNAGLDRLGTAISLTIAHPGLPAAPRFENVAAQDQAERKPDADDWPRAVGFQLLLKCEQALWPEHTPRAERISSAASRRCTLAALKHVSELALYANGLLHGWLPEDTYRDVAGFLAARVDDPQQAIELMAGINAIPLLHTAKLDTIADRNARLGLYRSFGTAPDPTIPAGTEAEIGTGTKRENVEAGR